MGMRLLSESFDDPLRYQVWGVEGDPEYHLSENEHVVINQWCIDALGYHARTAFNIYQLKNKRDVMTFKLKWA